MITQETEQKVEYPGRFLNQNDENLGAIRWRQKIGLQLIMQWKERERKNGGLAIGGY